MPGGVAGVSLIKETPYADDSETCRITKWLVTPAASAQTAPCAATTG